MLLEGYSAPYHKVQWSDNVCEIQKLPSSLSGLLHKESWRDIGVSHSAVNTHCNDVITFQ